MGSYSFNPHTRFLEHLAEWTVGLHRSNGILSWTSTMLTPWQVTQLGIDLLISRLIIRWLTDCATCREESFPPSVNVLPQCEILDERCNLSVNCDLWFPIFVFLWLNLILISSKSNSNTCVLWMSIPVFLVGVIGYRVGWFFKSFLYTPPGYFFYFWPLYWPQTTLYIVF